MPKAFESGIRPNRLEYIRESTTGTYPADPDWQLYSDNVRTLEPTIDAQTEAQRGLGSPDPIDHEASTEVAQLVVAYDLQEKASAGNTFLDGSNSNDAVTDALERDSDNRINNTHTVVRRMVQSDLDATNTINGSTSLDTRQYFVGVGGYVSEATITGDPTSPQPVMVELTYEFEKGRLYQIDQPSSSTKLRLYSTDSSDTGITVTIEDEDAGTSEDVSTDGSDGTTAVTTTESYDNIDAIELGSEATGDIQVYVDDSGSDGDQLAVIRGSDYYARGEGDLGVPALGNGSHNANSTSGNEIAQSYELVQDTTIERPSATSVGDIVNSTEISVNNNVEGMPQLGSPRRSLSAGDRNAEAAVTIAGETEEYQKVDDMLGVAGTNLVWTFTGGSIQLDTAAILEATAETEEAGQAKKAVDMTLEGKGVTVT